MSEFRVVPLTLGRANDLVERLHRHHGTLAYHIASIGAERTSDQRIIGAASRHNWDSLKVWHRTSKDRRGGCRVSGPIATGREVQEASDTSIRDPARPPSLRPSARQPAPHHTS